MALNGKDLKEMKAWIPVGDYARNEEYYQGDNTAILGQPEKKKPDNRVPIAFTNRLIKNLTGYAARPGDITIKPEDPKKENSFIKSFNTIAIDNHFDLLNSQIYKTVLKHGIGYDLTWVETDENGVIKLKVASVPVYQSLPIWSNELSPVKKMDAFVRYYNLDMPDVISPNGKDIKVKAGQYANIFYEGYYEIWLLSEKTEEKAKRNHSEEKSRKIATVEQPFKDVQVSSYLANDEMLPYWLPVKRIIDEFDKVISKNMNEVDRFNDTWVMFWQKVDPGIKRKIDQMGIIDNLQNAFKEGTGDIWPRFLERNVPTEHAKLMLDKFEQLIYTIIGVPSFLDESFNGASGVALLFRLIGLEYAAIETDTYFDLGLNHRIELIKQATGSEFKINNESVSEADIKNSELDIKHKRNLPMDVRSIVEDVVKLKAAGLSMQTILNYLPRSIVPDVEAELERIEKAKEEMFNRLDNEGPPPEKEDKKDDKNK